jgi:hypothetical protein
MLLPGMIFVLGILIIATPELEITVKVPND